MKSWRTSDRDRHCGYDSDHVIPAGETFLEIEINGRARIRCQACAVRYGDPGAVPEPQPGEVATE